MRHFNRIALSIAVAAIAATGVALAQSSGHGHGHKQHGDGPNPYAAFKDRQIKALSTEQQADLRNGRGMGLALAAEMNGYPGPMHVLQLADKLGLTAEQRTRFDAMFAKMKSEAVATGEQIIELERELDKQFVARSITRESLDRLSREIGEQQGHLRATHMRYHLETVAVLTPDQVTKYNSARGYTR